VTGDRRNVAPCFSVLKELCAAPSAKKISGWGATVPTYGDFMNMVDNAGGKGRYAQRLSLRQMFPPPYVVAALQYLEQQ
jgi:putative ATP-dependent endonuclease of the OLD family